MTNSDAQSIEVGLLWSNKWIQHAVVLRNVFRMRSAQKPRARQTGCIRAEVLRPLPECNRMDLNESQCQSH